MTSTDLTFNVAADDTLKITGARYSRQAVGTLSGSMAKYGEDVTTYPERLARNRGKAVWLTALPAVISHPRYAAMEAAERALDVHVAVGDVIRILSGQAEESGLWRIVAPSFATGDSCGLVRIEA